MNSALSICQSQTNFHYELDRAMTKGSPEPSMQKSNKAPKEFEQKFAFPQSPFLLSAMR